MRTFWQALEKLPRLAAFPSVWRERLGDDYEALKRLCLAQSQMRPISFPCPLRTSCAYRIVTRSDGSVAGDCQRDPIKCEHIELTQADITPLELDWHRLGAALCNALGLDARRADLNLFHTRQIGSWSIDAVPVILTIQTEVYDLLTVIAQLAARLHQKFILLTPTTELVDVNCKELLANNGAALFSLDAIVTLTSHGTLLPVRLPGELFASFRPDPSGSVSEEIARQLIAFVKALAVKYHFRKAPLYIVFLMYCADGCTVKQIARECKCGRSLVFERLRLLHQKLGRHPAELRQYSEHLEKIDASLSDPRARKIYRRGAINGDEADDA